MSKRTNTAQWEEKYQRWRIAVQKDGVRKQFYSSTPGRTGQREANAKADRWLDDGIGVKARRVEDLYQEWYATVVKTTGTGNQRNVESRWRTRILPAIGRKRITSLTEQDLQDVVNDAYSDGLAKKSLQSLCADMRAFCKWCRAKKLPAGEVKDLVGHSEDMDTFGVYGHALTGEDTETAQAVNGMFLKLLHAGK